MNENNHDTAEMGAKSSPWRRVWSRLTADPEPSVAHELYSRLVLHARFPVYFKGLGVPDTPEGRFEILALHVGLAVRRLYGLDEDGRAMGQALFDLMVADLDMNLRELGVGDLSVGKQVKRLAGQFYARLAVLNQAFDEGRMKSLSPMLETNVYGTTVPPEGAIEHLAEILAVIEGALNSQTPDALKTGRITLPDEVALIALGDREPLGSNGE